MFHPPVAFGRLAPSRSQLWEVQHTITTTANGSQALSGGRLKRSGCHCDVSGRPRSSPQCPSLKYPTTAAQLELHCSRTMADQRGSMPWIPHHFFAASTFAINTPGMTWSTTERAKMPLHHRDDHSACLFFQVQLGAGIQHDHALSQAGSIRNSPRPGRPLFVVKGDNLKFENIDGPLELQVGGHQSP